MRILQVIPAFSASFGGTVSVVRSISKELSKKHEVTIYTTCAFDKKRDFKELPIDVTSGNYQVVYFPRVLASSGFNISLSMARDLPKVISNYDIIHLHSWRNFQDLLVHRMAKKYDVPYVLQAHGSLPRMASKQCLKWLYDVLFGYRLLTDSSKLIAFNDMEAKQYESLSVPKDKIAVIPNGIDLTEYADLPSNGFFKKMFGINETQKIILYLGRINMTKGLDFLIPAYARMVKRFDSTDTLLVIAGPDDGYLSYVQSLAQNLGIANKVVFTGFLTEYEKKCAFVDSTIVVYLSSFEPFGLVSLEAAASFKPVIVSNNTPMANVIKNGKFGLSIEYGNIDEFAENVNLLLNDEELLQEMGQKGHDFIFENYNWANIIIKLEKVYEDALKSLN